MRVLLVGGGASFSLKDVENGYYDALVAAGVDVKLYLLDTRIGIAKKWLHTMWKARGKPIEQYPTWPDAIYRAGIEALEMALRFNVDWVLVISGMYCAPDVLEMMRRAGLKTAVLFTESPYDDDKQGPMARLVDMCWTTERSSVPFLRKFNPNTSYIRHAYDPARHTPVAEATSAQAHDVVFVGSSFKERIELLSAVDWSGIDLGLYGMWNLLPSRHKLRKYLRGGVVTNEEASALYRNAKIGLNLYRTGSGESLNPRAYELAACGVLQISDYRAEMDDIFDGSGVLTFDQTTTLESQIRAGLFWSPKVRALHAEFAQEAIAPHTFANRANQIIADLNAIIGQPIAKGA